MLPSYLTGNLGKARGRDPVTGHNTNVAASRESGLSPGTSEMRK